MSGPGCAERLLLPEALSGRLSPAEEKRVMAHLEQCAACQEAAAEIEVSLISLAVLRDERDNPTALAAGPQAIEPGPKPATPMVSRRRLTIRLLSAAAAVLLLAGGIAIGRILAPGPESVDFGPTLALAPPASAADQAPRGSVAVGTEGASLAVRLSATSLPAEGWYECVWVAAGQSRSAGSFRATDGVVKDIRLRVAPPQDSQTWDLQLVHHRGTASEVVLEGAAEYHP